MKGHNYLWHPAGMHSILMKTHRHNKDNDRDIVCRFSSNEPDFYPFDIHGLQNNTAINLTPSEASSLAKALVSALQGYYDTILSREHIT